jgi:hypothetical protein
VSVNYARSARAGGAHQLLENAFLVDQMGMNGGNHIKGVIIPSMNGKESTVRNGMERMKRKGESQSE